MALTLILQPEPSSFVKNPIEIRVESDNYYTANSAAAISYIEFTAAPTLAGSHLTISFNGIDVDMVSQTTPITYDGNHFRVKTGFETTDDWLNAFANQVLGNYFINTNYTVVVDEITNRVYFYPKEGGTEWAITYTATPGTSTTGVVAPGVTPVTRENFRVFLKITVLSGLFIGDREVELEMELLEESVFTARIEEILRSFFTREIPATELTEIAVMGGHTHVYQISYYEAYGEPIVEQYVFTPDDLFSSFLAGLDELYFPDNTFFTNYVAPFFKFLTWQKRTKRITTEQREWLAFLHTPGSAYTTYEVRVKAFYTDDTNETQYLLPTDIAIYLGYDYLLQCYFESSYDLIVGPWASGIVTKYEVTVVEQTTHTVLSETFTFIIEEELPANTRYFLFENSMSFYDTLRTTGDRVTGIDVSGELLKKYMPADYAQADGKYLMSGADAKMKFTQNTGWLKGNKIAEYLLLFFISPAIYEIIDGEKIPIVITRKEIMLSADNDKKWALEFEYFYAYDQIGLASKVL